MALVTPRSTGAFSTGTGSITPAMPAGWQAGDLLLLFTGVHSGSETLATPSGWTLLSPDVNAIQTKIYGRIAVGGDTGPTIDWSGTNSSAACIAAYTGDVYTDLSTIVHASSDRSSVSTTAVTLPSLTISSNDCFIVRGGWRFKTATANAATFTSFPSGFSKDAELIQSGSLNAFVLLTKQQAAAASLTLDTADLSIADTSDATKGFSIALKTQAAVASSILYVPQKNVFVNDTIIQF